jgi:tetratricopeptide (TPR) repeat protein
VGVSTLWFWGLGLFVAMVFSGTLLAAPQHDEHPMPASFDEPIRLYDSSILGTFARPISSKNPQAQAYFNQGFRLMYAFAKPEAGRSFREAQRRDPDCAICYWGEAWAWGSYVNGRMTAQQAPRAYAAIQKALSLSPHADEKERAFIQAMAKRYAASFDPATVRAQDAAYAQAMKRVVERYPDDLDAAALYAESLFLLLPRPGALEIRSPRVLEILTVLERTLARDVRHPGACHLYVHTTELTTEPGRAEKCVAFLGSSMPGASHINHMPSHTWSKVGRWGDAVQASLRAWESDQKALKGQGIMTYPAHDLQMLLFAASMDGQGDLAVRAGQGLAKLTRDPTYHALALIRFGRFADVASLGARPTGDLSSGMWEFAQGYAQLRRGDGNAARLSLDRLRAVGDQSKSVFKIHPVRTLLGIVAAILDGEIRRASGDLTGAVSAFERAVALQDGLIIDEPEPLPFAARHWLGACLIESGRAADAERVYSADLTRHPHNGWSLIGLKRALEAQKKSALIVDDDLRASWTRADKTIAASRF